ncbi:MAG: protein kinase [Cyanobacteria bacterium]|nr:protein kinase [Cyanobacteriota bacterium]
MQNIDPTDRCPTCGKSTAKSESVSLTQWIFGGGACSCHSGTEKADAPTDVQICDTCRKPRYVGTRRGSITQWVLRSYACSCSSHVSSTPAPQEELIELLRQTMVPERRAVVEENLPSSDADLQKQLGMSEDRYIALEELGHGNSAQVLSCYDKYLRKRVALKTLAMPHWSETKILYFQQEAKILSRLTHPNIVGILDLGITDRQQPYMVMDLIDGIPLSKLIERSGSLSIASVTALLNNACSGLQYAHDRDILHCDIAPHNLMCRETEDGLFSLQFIDFGLSRIVSSEGESRGPKLLAGSPVFMCPDALLGRKYDERSEIYSLACVVFFALTGEPPYQPQGSPLLTSSFHANRSLPSFRDVRPDLTIPEPIEFVVSKALSKTPEERYQTVAEFQDAWNSAVAEISAVKPQGNTNLIDDLRTLARRKNTFLYLFLVAVLFMGLLAAPLILSREIASEKNEKRYAKKVDNDFMDERWNRAGSIFNKEIIPAYENIPSADLTKVKQADPATLITEPELILIDTSVTDTDLKVLRQCKMLAELDLTGTKVTEGAIEDIVSVKSLKRLYLGGISLTSRSITALSRIPALEELRLTGCGLGNAQIKSLSQLKNLRSLKIDNNPRVTDSGVKYLCKLSDLKTIDISGTGISAAGMKLLETSKTLEIQNRASRNRE